jgi:hypothetical protein
MTEKNPVLEAGKEIETNIKRLIVKIQTKKDKILHGMGLLVVLKKDNKSTLF